MRRRRWSCARLMRSPPGQIGWPWREWCKDRHISRAQSHRVWHSGSSGYKRQHRMKAGERSDLVNVLHWAESQGALSDRTVRPWQNSVYTCFILTNLHIERGRFSLYESERIHFLTGGALLRGRCCVTARRGWKTSSVLYSGRSIFLIISHFNTRSCTFGSFSSQSRLVALPLTPLIILYHRTASLKTHFKRRGWDAKRQKRLIYHVGDSK